LYPSRTQDASEGSQTSVPSNTQQHVILHDLMHQILREKHGRQSINTATLGFIPSKTPNRLTACPSISVSFTS